MTPTSLVFVLLLLTAPNLKAAPPPPEIRGQLLDWKDVGLYPNVIWSRRALDALAVQWGIKDLPTVDFNRYVLAVKITLGREQDLETVADAGGNLEFANPENLPRGFRTGTVNFGLKAVDRSTCKTVFGKPLPMD